MDHSHPIRVLKLELRHDCKRCVSSVEKMFSEIDGVEAVMVDAKNDTVTVTGDVDSQILLDVLREVKNKMGKKSSKSNNKGKQKEETEHVSEPYVPKTTLCKDPFCKTHQSGFVIKSDAPALNGHYLPPHLGFAPPVNYPQQMYPSSYYPQRWPQSQPRLQRPFGLDRQVAHPPFDPYTSQRLSRQVAPPYWGQNGYY